MSARHSHSTATPPFLPHAIVTVATGGAITATLDGVPVEPGAFEPPWCRNRFGDLLDALTLQGTRAVRVELREVDGQVFTDIVLASQRSAPEPQKPTPHELLRKPRSAPALVEVSGQGFIPGEDVSVAVGVSFADASPHGEVRAVLDLAHLPDAASEIVLVGRVSGKTVVRDLT